VNLKLLLKVLRLIFMARYDGATSNYAKMYEYFIRPVSDRRAINVRYNQNLLFLYLIIETRYQFADIFTVCIIHNVRYGNIR